MAERPPGMKVFVSNAADIGGGASGGLTDTQLRASAVPVSVSGGATSAKQDTQITAEQAILAKIIAAPATEAKQDTQITDLGGVTETAPATDTASSGLNGRLQRVAQRITSLITALGSPFQAGGALGAGTAYIGVTGGTTAIAGGTFTRPSDANVYASGDLVANSTTAGSVTPITVSAARVNDGTGMLRRIRLSKSSTSVTNTSFRVHFYKTTPTVTNGDNGVWLSTESTYLGSCDVTMDKAFSDGAKGIGAPNSGSEINFAPSSGTTNIFALIEARAAYTPTSAETFTLACEILQN